MSTVIFDICINNGFFFKMYVDFLASCIFSSENNKICLRVDQNGIKMEYITDKYERNKCHVCAFLNRISFKKYVITRNIEINIEPKQVQKLCRNIKKRDKVVLTFIENEKSNDLILSIYNDNFTRKEERKNIPYSSFYEKNDENSLSKPTNFYSFPFSIGSSEIQNVKKVIGVKKECLTLCINKDKFLSFSGLSQGISHFEILYGNDEYKNNISNINISGSILAMFSKLSQISQNINFYEEIQNENECKIKMLKITSVLDIPSYMGDIEIILCEFDS
uniref:Proliferating cell nuclear antigen PCNA N-terminal domain-containing protein n=1 Tax=viral metagenome TaxID=1070528 RepID=A0A6C0JQW2_9ZZZZ